MQALSLDRARTLSLVASALLFASVLAAMLPGHPAAAAIPLAALGVVAGVLQIAPGTAQLIWRRRSLLLLVVLAGLVVAWVAVGIADAGHPQRFYEDIPNGHPYPSYGINGYFESSSWPWRVGRLPLWALVLTALCAAGGFVLIADAVRVQVGLARPPRSVWRSITAAPTRGGRIAVRAVPGIVLIAVAALFAVSLTDRYAADHPIAETLLLITIFAAAALLILSPVALGAVMRLDFDKESRAREHERQRFAAHLHDSVLQTLALIQRQAGDTDTVITLARRQEHALRAWMAGEADLGSATIAGALRDMVSELEDEAGLKVELTAIGDAKLDARKEELVAAAREALRNVLRHAPGASVNVFLDVGETGTEVFIRDSGPGFDFAEVPVERRGLRDAVIGRMQFAGGSATVESQLGEGTEVALLLPHANGRGR